MNRWFAKFLSVMLVVVLLVGSLPMKAEAAEEEEQSNFLIIDVNFQQEEARSMLKMINDFRLSEPWVWKNYASTEKTTIKDLEPLTYDYRLEQAAMQRAAEMAVYFAHSRPNGHSFTGAIYEVGSYQALWENGAWGYTTAKATFEGLCEEDENYSYQGHRRTMLLSGINAVGIGHVIYNGIHFWAQEFAYMPEDKMNTTPTYVPTYTTQVTMPIDEKYVSIDSLTSINAQELINCGTDYIPTVKVSGYSMGAYRMSFSGILSPNWTCSDTEVLKPLGNGTFRSQKPGVVTLTGSFGGKSINISVVVGSTFAISRNEAVLSGEKATFKVLKTEDAASYQWQVSKNGGSTWKNINTATYPSAATRTLSFKTRVVMDGYLYRCEVTLANGTTCFSRVARLSVAPNNVILVQPEDAIVVLGNRATFSVAATDEAKTYTWQVSKNNGATWKNVSVTSYPSAATESLTFMTKETLNGYLYRCVVTFEDGTKVVSDSVKLTVAYFVQQPVGMYGTVGGAASFDAEINTTAKSYRWQVSKDGGRNWKNISAKTYPSAITSSLSFTVKDGMDGYWYRCNVTLPDGTVVTSNEAKLSLPSVDQQPVDATAEVGEEVTFIAHGTTAVNSYRWQVSKDGGATWKNVSVTGYPSAATNTLMFTTKESMDGFYYRCQITFFDGTVLTTDPALLTLEYSEEEAAASQEATE